MSGSYPTPCMTPDMYNSDDANFIRRYYTKHNVWHLTSCTKSKQIKLQVYTEIIFFIVFLLKNGIVQL
jgi:hypothetical protein